MKRYTVLYPVAYFSPEITASSHLENDRFEVFKGEGIHTEVVTPRPCRGLTEEEYELYRDKMTEVLYDGTVTVRRFNLFREGHNPLARALRYILMECREYFICRKAEGIDLILCGSTPPIHPVMCAHVKKHLSRRLDKAVPMVFIVQDLFPESLVNAGICRRGSLMWKIGKRMMRAAYRHSDAIITINDDFKRAIIENGVDADKIVVARNWVNTDDVYPVPRAQNSLFDSCGLDRSLFYVSYSGNIGHSQNLGMLLQAAKKLEKQLPRLRFLLIGEGAAREQLKSDIERERLGNVIMLPFQDYAHIAEVFCLGDIGLIISKPGVGVSSVPSKTWSIMAAKRPIIASFDLDSELSRTIDASRAGIVVAPEDVEGFCDAIVRLYRDADLRKCLGQNGRAYLSEHLDKTASIGKYVNTIKRLVDLGG